MTRKTAAILNVTGYAGAELARLLHAHPGVELACVTGRSAAGKRLPEVYPHLFAIDLPVVEAVPEDRLPDVVFSALPHGAAAEQVAPLVRAGATVVDVSADFRLKDVATYERTYKVTHPAPELVADAVFGLPELHRDEIATSRLVAVPGCHSTGVILALAPLVAAGLVEPRMIADTKTGLSGAGRTLGLSVHFSEADSSVAPYGLDGHRHVPEMVQELAALRAEGNGQRATGEGQDATVPNDQRPTTNPLTITFVPHYIPMVRGILSTCYAEPRAGVTATKASLLELFREFYAGHPFVHVSETPPATKHVLGSNYVIVHPTVAPDGRVVVASALDNLGKGAAGAMVQCANLVLGLEEDAGLRGLGVYP
ncbi:MAG TPA: NAGSA dehydrogenase family protein [Dehalococcoidia bacterium]|nr:NAGSA dehydrogenase family protein [Dehalococcoidia bacterium]